MTVVAVVKCVGGRYNSLMRAQNDRHLIISADGAVAQLTLNRPEARNAIDMTLGHQVDEAMTALEGAPAIRVIIISGAGPVFCAGAGPVFCAGADLKALAAGEGDAFIEDRGWAGFTSRSAGKPTVAAVEGPALAGGCELVLACDLAVCSSQATFGLPEVKHGLIAASGGAARLPAAIGPKVALELLLTGSPIDAHRALSLGLVNHVVEPGDAVADAWALARQVGSNGVAAVAAARRVVAETMANGEERGQRLALDLLEHLIASQDARERLDEFVRFGASV
jgi:enoyl-CoA hydratase/carnithine racemase